MERPDVKPVDWVGAALDDLRGFPDEVRRDVGHRVVIESRGRSKESRA